MIHHIYYDWNELLDLNKIKKISPTTILLHRFNEHRYYENLRENINFEDIIDLAHEIGSKVIVTSGIYSGEEFQWISDYRIDRKNFKKKIDIPSRYDIVNLQTWETYGFLEQVMKWTQYKSTADSFKLESIQQYNSDFIYPFITMNNGIKTHRVLQIDYLAKYNLLDKGKFSWNSFNYNSNGLRNLKSSYNCEWRYWKPEIVLLDDFFGGENSRNKGKGPDGSIVPEQYKNSFMQIVTETAAAEIYITEKTAAPLQFGKLFLVNGAPGFHAALKKIGFELYDEIFDYTFDQEPNLHNRVELLTKNILNFSDKDPEELKSIYNSLLPKIQYNKKHFLNITLSLNKIPPVYLELYDTKECAGAPWHNCVDYIKKGILNEYL